MLKKETYFKASTMFEHLHRLFLEVIKLHLYRCNIKDINNVQCIILYHIGKDNLDEITFSEVVNKGYYLGSNFSFNLEKMVNNGYVEKRIVPRDHRSNYLKLSEKGISLFHDLDKIFEKHANQLAESGFSQEDSGQLIGKLNEIKEFWVDMLQQ